MSIKTYTLVLLSLSILFLVCFILGSTKMEQYSGSESRMGGFLERDYGWNDQQTHFKPHQFVQHGTIEEYVTPVDLIVIGDSFSYTESSWIYFLLQNNKKSVLFMHIDRVTVKDLLANEIFRTNPPQHLVLQSMEGFAFQRFRRIGHSLRDVAENIKSVEPASLAPKSTMVDFEAYEVDRNRGLSFKERMAISGDYYLKQLRREVFGEKSVSAMAIRVDCDSCFSNTKKGFFLSQSSSVDKGAYKLSYRKDAIDGLTKMKSTIERNGFTKFYSTVFPNKVNVYLEFTELGSNPTIFSPPIPAESTNFINILPDVRDAILSGVRDVYLPNDHHMGSQGYSVVAETIGRHLYDDRVAPDQPKN